MCIRDRYINANSKKTLTVAIYSMIGKYDINWGNVAAGTLIAMPVSYTHLDVYKRQG